MGQWGHCSTRCLRELGLALFNKQRLAGLGSVDVCQSGVCVESDVCIYPLTAWCGETHFIIALAGASVKSAQLWDSLAGLGKIPLKHDMHPSFQCSSLWGLYPGHLRVFDLPCVYYGIRLKSQDFFSCLAHWWHLICNNTEHCVISSSKFTCC